MDPYRPRMAPSDPPFWVAHSYELLIKNLDLISRPVGFPEELEAGFDTRVIFKAVDPNAKGEVVPTVGID